MKESLAATRVPASFDLRNEMPLSGVERGCMNPARLPSQAYRPLAKFTNMKGHAI